MTSENLKNIENLNQNWISEANSCNLDTFRLSNLKARGLGKFCGQRKLRPKIFCMNMVQNWTFFVSKIWWFFSTRNKETKSNSKFCGPAGFGNDSIWLVETRYLSLVEQYYSRQGKTWFWELSWNLGSDIRKFEKYWKSEPELEFWS